MLKEASERGGWPFVIWSVQNAEDGIILAAQVVPQVIVLDTYFGRDRLPGDQGVAFIRNAKAFRRVRVVGMARNPRDGRKLLEAGADAVLQRPFGMEDLRKSLLG